MSLFYPVSLYFTKINNKVLTKEIIYIYYNTRKKKAMQILTCMKESRNDNITLNMHNKNCLIDLSPHLFLT